MAPVVSVIIPIYGVERYIGRCARSLMRQLLNDVEFIFVDDATPDRSMEVLAEVISHYPLRASQIKILHHDVNRGLPAARNTGLAAATGDYIFHCDADDYLETTTLYMLYRQALDADADMVWCDWLLTFELRERYMSEPNLDTPEAVLQAMLNGRMKYNVWNKLVRRTLYTDNGITFPEGHAMGEDMTMIMLAACAKSVVYVERPLYYYVKSRNEAFTNTMNATRRADIVYNVERVTDFITSRYGESMRQSLTYFRQSVKLPWLLSADRSLYRMWRTTFTEANKHIWSNPHMPLRNKLLQWAARWHLDLLLKAYYYTVYKVVYGLIYR